jgi:phosphoribosyl-ATP pyrophosphohydrolase
VNSATNKQGEKKMENVIIEKIVEEGNEITIVKKSNETTTRVVKIRKFIDGYMLYFGLFRKDCIGLRFDEIAKPKAYKKEKNAKKKAIDWVTLRD